MQQSYWLFCCCFGQNNHFSSIVSLSAVTAVKIAILLEELSPASFDVLAKSLKFHDNTSKSIIKRYTGWKRILVMVLELENKYVHREGDTVFELKNKLARLHDNYCDTKEKRMIYEALLLLSSPPLKVWNEVLTKVSDLFYYSVINAV